MALIMLVEDQLFLRSALSRILSSHGYRVLPYASIADVRVALEDGVEFDAVVSDYVLPDGTGKELIALMHRSHTVKVPIVLMSGWQLPPDELPAHVCTIRKPFDPNHLVEELRALLRSARSLER